MALCCEGHYDSIPTCVVGVILDTVTRVPINTVIIQWGGGEFIINIIILSEQFLASHKALSPEMSKVHLILFVLDTCLDTGLMTMFHSLFNRISCLPVSYLHWASTSD